MEYGRKRRTAYRSGRKELANLGFLRPYFLHRNGNKTKRRVNRGLSYRMMASILTPSLKYSKWNRH